MGWVKFLSSPVCCTTVKCFPTLVFLAPFLLLRAKKGGKFFVNSRIARRGVCSRSRVLLACMGPSVRPSVPTGSRRRYFRYSSSCQNPRYPTTLLPPPPPASLAPLLQVCWLCSARTSSWTTPPSTRTTRSRRHRASRRAASNLKPERTNGRIAKNGTDATAVVVHSRRQAFWCRYLFMFVWAACPLRAGQRKGRGAGFGGVQSGSGHSVSLISVGWRDRGERGWSQ